MSLFFDNRRLFLDVPWQHKHSLILSTSRISRPGVCSIRLFTYSLIFLRIASFLIGLLTSHFCRSRRQHALKSLSRLSRIPRWIRKFSAIRAKLIDLNLAREKYALEYVFRLGMQFQLLAVGQLTSIRTSLAFDPGSHIGVKLVASFSIYVNVLFGPRRFGYSGRVSPGTTLTSTPLHVSI